METASKQQKHKKILESISHNVIFLTKFIIFTQKILSNFY